MPLYNFKQRFVPYIMDGSKMHTIRAIRKNPAKPGDMLYLYTGLRSKYAKRLITAQCTAVKTIFVLQDGTMLLVDAIFNAIDCQLFYESYLKNEVNETVTWKKLTEMQKNKLAWHDGFRPVHDALLRTPIDAMMQLFKEMHSLPFAGHIICWHPQPASLTYLQ